MPDIPAIDGLTDASDARVMLYQSGRQVHAPVGSVQLVVGPSSATDNAIARFNGTTGKIIQNSGATIDDSGNLTAVGGIFTSLLDLSGASAGQIKFPAGQNPSSDVNTLDDYEEGTWTTGLTFDTAGDVSVVYSGQTGQYTKVGRLVHVTFTIITTTFTHTTAAGNLRITGLPFTVSGFAYNGSIEFTGLTLPAGTNFVQLKPVAAQSYCNLMASAPRTVLAVAQHTTGTNVTMVGTATYTV